MSRRHTGNAAAWFAIYFGIGVWIAVLSGCARTPVTVIRHDASEMRERALTSALTSDSSSLDTQQVLRLEELSESYDSDPRTAIAELDQRHHQDPRPDRARALAELALLQSHGESQDSLPWALLAALRAWEYIWSAPADDRLEPRFSRTVAVYERAVERVLRLGFVGAHNDASEIQLPSERLRLQVAEGDGIWPLDYFDELIAAAELEIRGLRNRYRRPGIGAALVGVRENRNTQDVERYRPPEGIIEPASAILDFGPRSSGDTRVAHLFLYDSRKALSHEVAGSKLPIAADFSAPYAYLLSRTKLRQIGYTGLLTAEETRNRLGWYLLEPYDPDKIPVLMVHGLRSSPLVWTEITNDVLLGDPELRQNYQIWHYLYPTGIPYLYSAMLMREKLEELRRFLDPEGEDRATQEMVVVAHSMGGLLSKTLVSKSESTLWDATFQVEPHELDAEPSDIETLQRIFQFRPKNYVKRIVFIATPHRGSSVANQFIGRVGEALLTLPRGFRSLFQRVTRRNPEATTPEMRSILEDGGPSSIRALAPEHPLIEVLADVPFDPKVPVHSIIGDRGQGGGTDASDGVVLYQSSHIQGASSEVIVPAGHDAYSHPQAVAEVRRILCEHIHKRSQSAP